MLAGLRALGALEAELREVFGSERIDALHGALADVLAWLEAPDSAGPGAT